MENQNLIEYAQRVRRAVAKTTQRHGTTGYPEVEIDGIPLRLGQAEDGPCWYCPELYGIELIRAL